MKILITGANGFVGQHLVRELEAHGHELCAFTFGEITVDLSAVSDVREINVVDSERIATVLAELQPDACIHLAGISFVPEAAASPAHVYAVNTMGTASVLEAVRKNRPAARVLTVSTSQVYGPSRGGAISEDEPLAPANHYGVSKAAADWMTLRYAADHDLYAMTARPQNHIGPGQSLRFVVPAFAAQIKQIAEGKIGGEIMVGNLDSVRDFTDVRDVVRAYRLLVEKGQSGQAYNIASGQRVRIGEILERLCAIAGVKPRVVVDQSLYRKAEECPNLDTGRIRSCTGWKPEISLETSLRDIYASV